MKSGVKLIFYGGAQTVTGTNYLLESGPRKILIDCGLFQGSHYAERQNFEPFPYNPKDIEAVFITHSHLDHIGRLPKLWKDGFRGTIFSTPPTKDFSELLLLDSEHILGKEAEREGKPPLYTVSDIQEMMRLWHKIEYHHPVKIGEITAEFFDAGHILGSAIIKIEVAAQEGEPRPNNGRDGKTIVFSGDLGNYPSPIINKTETIKSADYCVIESAYGDRVHGTATKSEESLEDAIEDIVKTQGVLLIPAFAMERTQDLLFHLNGLVEKKRVPALPIFIDSPLAIKLTAVYKKYENYFNKETYNLVRSGDDILNFPGLRLALTTEQSREINSVPPPKVIIAGSGMSHGGRILHHEIRYLPDPKNMILFVGYQAKDSLGRQILDGSKRVNILGEEVEIRCKKKVISSYSAHADQPRLLAWLRPMRLSLKTVFVVQGEPEASAALAQKIKDELAIEAVIPKPLDEFVL
jgi:metallo-beta-lactamase family protein